MKRIKAKACTADEADTSERSDSRSESPLIPLINKERQNNSNGKSVRITKEEQGRRKARGRVKAEAKAELSGVVYGAMGTGGLPDGDHCSIFSRIRNLTGSRE